MGKQKANLLHILIYITYTTITALSLCNVKNNIFERLHNFIFYDINLRPASTKYSASGKFALLIYFRNTKITVLNLYNVEKPNNFESFHDVIK